MFYSNTSNSVEVQEQRVLDQAADFERRFHISADDESNSRRDSIASAGPVCISLIRLVLNANCGEHCLNVIVR